MVWQAWFTLFDVFIIIGLLIFTRTSPDVVLLGGLTLLLVSGVLTPEQALDGLSNEGLVTVGVLYVVVAGLRDTGGVHWLMQWIFGQTKSLFMAQVRLMAPVTFMSAFLNNTPVVAMLIPAVKDWARQNQLAISKLMIPLSYASILGGTCTLIGTSTNLIVNGLMADEPGMSTLGMFDITWVGFPCAVVGMTYILLIGRYMLPDRRPVMSNLQDTRQYTIEMFVEPGSALVGKTIEQAGLRNLPGMFLAEIDREGRIIPAVSPQEKLEGNDRLVFVGIVESVVDLQKIRGLKPASDQVFKLDSPRPERCLIETVVSTSCKLVGKSIRDGRFRSTYNAVVIAVARHGERIKKKIGDIVLQPGDTLLLEAHPNFFNQLRHSREFYLMSRIENSNPPRHENAYLAVLILTGMVLSVSLLGVKMLIAAMVAAGLMIITRSCSVLAARNSVDWQVLLVIAASFGIGRAMFTTGLAEQIATSLISLAKEDPWITLAIVYFVTTLFTEFITNNAAAVLVFPIALSTSQQLGVNFFPFAITIMMAASASFSSPIGYQTNLMVYGPGGYRFSDYIKIGLPLNVMLGITTVILVPIIWGF